MVFIYCITFIQFLTEDLEETLGAFDCCQTTFPTDINQVVKIILVRLCLSFWDVLIKYCQIQMVWIYSQ